MTINEQTWRRANKDQVKREFQEKHRQGSIRSPGKFLPPTTLYLSKGQWVMALGFFEPLKVL